MNRITALDIEEKSKTCREFVSMKTAEILLGAVCGNLKGLTKKRNYCCIKETPQPNHGVWALKHEGKSYCFIENEKPSCALEESAVLTRKMYSAADGFQEITARHYVCRLKNSGNNGE